MTTSPPTLKPRRRWLQFSLRTTLVLTLVFGAGFGWLGMTARQASKQREALGAIQKLGGSYNYYVSREGSSLNPPKWMRKLFGDDFLNDVQAVALTGSKVTDAELADLRELEQLQGLDLESCTSITDAGLEHVRRLTRLQVLFLDGTQVTDAGLTYLQDLKQLEELSLGQVSDVGIVQLKEVRQLRVLHLNGTQISDGGLIPLRDLPNLETLDLGQTRITDAGLEHLRGLTRLKDLWLYGAPVTESGVREVKQALPNLTIHR